MLSNLAQLYSQSAQQMKSSEIRELLKLLNRPEMISFAGGLPNPDAFPIEKLRPVLEHVMRIHSREALQYGTTEGHAKLRDVIARGMGTYYGASQEMSNIIISNGSQQAFNLLAGVFIDPGDQVITGNPTYLGALMTLRAHQAKVSSVMIDELGINVDALEERIKYMEKRKEKIKMIYLVPTFQNPTGVTLPLDRRERIYELICKHNILLVEDDPYGLLRYDGDFIAPIKSMDTDGRVIYMGTFSKILAPGFRVGWMAGPEEIVRKAAIAKQAQDLCTNSFGQYCIFEAIYHDILFPHIEEIKNLYRKKRDLMLSAISEYFPKEAEYNHPMGGMFLWIKLPAYINTMKMFSRALENNVAYVTGVPFYPEGGGQNTFRLNFSYASDDSIKTGIERLALVINEELREYEELKDDIDSII